MDHGQILEQPYYTTAPTTSTDSTNSLVMSAIDFSALQGFQQPTPPQAQAAQQFSLPAEQQPYSQIDFFYENPHLQPQQQQQPTNTNTTPFPQIPINSTTNNETTALLNSTVDEDYVQNLTNELQHTKQLLKQYQLRTEQLMELVTKQTDKIKELREQINNKNTTA